MPTPHRSSRASIVVTALFACALSSPGSRAARTVTHYPLANGFAAATVSLADGRLQTFRPSVYQALDEGLIVPELCYDAYFGVRTSSQSLWLTRMPVGGARPLDDANALELVQDAGALRVTTTWLAPMGLSHPAVLAVVTAENRGSTPLTEVSFPTLANFRVGDGVDGRLREHAAVDAATGAIVERGTRGAMIAIPLAGGLHVTPTMSPRNPYLAVEQDLPLVEVRDSGVADEVVHGFSFAPVDARMVARARAEFGVLYVYVPASEGLDAAIAAALSDVAAWRADRSAPALKDAELAAARAFVASSSIPVGLSDDERRLWGASLALLRAAQVREADSGVARRRPTGQIVAALPPGIWNITWVRDASYAIEGLLDAGKVDEAAAGLRFFLHGDAGEYRDYVGTEYLLSVVRTYGGGREESDWNAGGPNVEWDNFGLFLRAYARALEEGALLDDALPVVKHEVADVLLHLRDGTTGLLTPDSSIWETHWTPTPESKGKQTWTYSTATAVAGLRAFADALAARGDLDAARYEGAAADMANAVARELVTSSGALASNREERLANIGVLDAAVVEALNRDVLDARGAVARTTLDSLRGLRSTHTPGYFRSDEGGLYDSREWIVVDLWLSRAFRRTGNVVEAQRLLAHVTQTGLDNLGQLPELLDEQGRVAGSTPMMGFGAGAYLTALVERARDARRPTVGTDAGVVVEPGPPVAEEPRTDAGVGEGEALEAEGEDARVDAGSVVAGGAEHPEHPEEPVHDDDGAPVDAPHCSCSSSSEPTPAASLALVTSALLLLRRRRWRMR